ncbi:serine hydrolase domain-containing protein [Brevibacillus laterosporus]|uniref:serine hydrolase domain-containing protein n=1 Tax=Brevibacillus laterosporus TaxID=1465 RepID=UPI000E6D15D0|nr:serine hydrolase domain-containing protein [Brevibacillus laterosporus]AYB37925.1 class A beta-lactamase-related serine hydrolase [Brevibacillus laterosporus]MBM7107804.1 D-alanyl-D-alanine carboxypeptidase precursor [Brevibacillus laterosporus]
MLLIKELEHQIMMEMEQARVPGLAIAIIHNKELIYANGFGVTSVQDPGVAISPQTLFRIGSISKLFTSTLIMKLVENGLLDLDTPIINYIPWFSLQNSAYNGLLTLRTLLSHSAGFSNGGDYLGSRESDGLRRHVSEELSKMKLMAPPGKLHTYSNFHYNLAGCVAEEVTGKTFATLMQELVFSPLKMNSSTYDPLFAMTHSLALPHYIDDDQICVLHRFLENTAYYPSFFAMSTVTDLAKFALLHMNKGCYLGKQLLQSESIQQMHEYNTPLYNTYQSGFGLGFFLQETENGLRISRHFGDISSYSADFVMHTEAGSAVIILNNRPFQHDKITRLVFDQLQLPHSHVKTSKELFKGSSNEEDCLGIAGTFFGTNVGIAEITKEDQSLLILNNQRIRLQIKTSDFLQGYDEEGNHVMNMGVIREEDGCVQYLMINNNRCHRYLMPSGRTSLSEEALEACCGTYSHHGFPDWVYHVTYQDNKLIMEEDGITDILIPIEHGLFVSDTFKSVQFHIDEQGQVPYFYLHGTWKMERLHR